jgi:hypothetical protein
MKRPARSLTNDGFVGIILLLVVVVVLTGGIYLALARHKSAKPAVAQSANLHSYCVGQPLTTSASGHCVSDVQTMVNYMEHSGLTECPFMGGATLVVSGTYDATTSAQVQSVQAWSQCYAKQEGFSSNVKQTGNVDKSTWGELCTYSYTDPLHTSATDANTAISAGKDAGCAQLQS